MKLYAISDLHLSYPENQIALSKLPNFPDDWLTVVGDIGETDDLFHFALSILSHRFAKVIWTPGNHDLWSHPATDSLVGVNKYQHLLDICHQYKIITPEDDYIEWTGEGTRCWLIPMMLWYDYSFRPDSIDYDSALGWAHDSGLMCKDEYFLNPCPYSCVPEWCAERVEATHARILRLDRSKPFILMNHYPLNSLPLQRLKRIPRFSIWCGTNRTQHWHRELPTHTVVYGHLHIRATDICDGVRFEEVSLGYPKHWDANKNISYYLREILPGGKEPVMPSERI